MELKTTSFQGGSSDLDLEVKPEGPAIRVESTKIIATAILLPNIQECQARSGNVWDESLAIRDGSELRFLADKTGGLLVPSVLQVER